LNQVVIRDYPEKIVDYHVDLLAEAGYLKGIDFSGGSSTKWIEVSLSWDGHEFIDDAKNEETWNKFKDIVEEKGTSISFAVATSLIIALAKQSVGLP